MPAQLLSLTDGPTLLLDKPILLIGRHEECDVQLNSRKVSRKHCCIAQVQDYLVVRDVGSTNGVRINGVRVKEGILRTGDELTIGNFRYQVHADVPREVLPPPVPSRPAAAPPRPKVSEDELLEAAEEPVPLTEEPSSPVPSARKPPTALASPPPAPRSDNSFYIPDDIRLKPESSLHPPPPAVPPPV